MMLEALLVPRTRDLGDGFTVRRALPAITDQAGRRRSVGPFVFFDQMGPALLAPGQGLDVRPHPHIGLATVTYLFEGEILHRDSLGTVQVIRPGDVNWMTAGRGIVHSERTPPEPRARGSRLSGIQTWVALPRAQEESAPAFAHFPEPALPLLVEKRMRMRLILGESHGARSPVATLGAMFYADALLESDATLALDFRYEERAAYVVEGTIEHDGARYGAGQMLVFRARDEVLLSAREKARLVLFGGEPLDGERILWWNFVSSRRPRIAQAADDWKAGRFAGVPGDGEFIPLPDGAPGVADYP
jgi:redox-sensitive bicupin YhaK (pirin superfamily)